MQQTLVVPQRQCLRLVVSHPLHRSLPPTRGTTTAQPVLYHTLLRLNRALGAGVSPYALLAPHPRGSAFRLSFRSEPGQPKARAFGRGILQFQELREEGAVMERERPSASEGRIPEAWIGQEVMLDLAKLKELLEEGRMILQDGRQVTL